MSSIDVIDANVDAWMSGLISYEEFTRLQRATWQQIESSPEDAKKTLRVIRRRLNAAGE